MQKIDLFCLFILNVFIVIKYDNLFNFISLFLKSLVLSIDVIKIIISEKKNINKIAVGKYTYKQFLRFFMVHMCTIETSEL